MNLNAVHLIGRLGKDPEVRTLESGKKVANFSLAVTRTKEITDWINVVVWDKAAEIVENYVKKGSELGVSGSIQTRSWEKDGVTKYITEVVAYTVHLGAKPESNNTTPEVINEDDLPF